MVAAVFKTVKKDTRFWLTASLASVLFFTGALWVSQAALIYTYLTSDTDISLKVSFLLSLYGMLLSNHTLYSASLLSIIAVLSGLNVALLMHYIKRVQSKGRSTTIKAVSVMGIVAGFLGVGCAACGSVVLTALLAAFGAGGVLFLLPFYGAEIGVLSVLIITVSIYVLIKKIHAPLVCVD